jgi:hypothetical protein
VAARTDNGNAFRADIDLDKTRVDRLVELAETRDETDRALLDVLVRVGERAARELANESDAGSNTGNHGAIETVLKMLATSKVGTYGHRAGTQVLRVRGLHVATTEWLNSLHKLAYTARRGVTYNETLGRRGGHLVDTRKVLSDVTVKLIIGVIVPLGMGLGLGVDGVHDVRVYNEFDE